MEAVPLQEATSSDADDSDACSASFAPSPTAVARHDDAAICSNKALAYFFIQVCAHQTFKHEQNSVMLRSRPERLSLVYGRVWEAYGLGTPSSRLSPFTSSTSAAPRWSPASYPR